MDFLYAPIPPNSLPLQPPLHTAVSTSGQGSDSSNFPNSVLFANGMDTVITSTDAGIALNSTWSTVPTPSTQAFPLNTTWSTAPAPSTQAFPLNTTWSTAPAPSTQAFPLNTTWSTAPAPSTQAFPTHGIDIITPPPESNGFPPAYPYPVPSWQSYGIVPNQTTASSMVPTTLHGSLHLTDNCYLYGSSLEDSPLSSPGSSENNFAMQDLPLQDESQMSYGFNQSSGTMTTSSKSHSPLCNNVYTQANMIIPDPVMTSYAPTLMPSLENKDFGLHASKEVKMPQRKGGIQLWQFLYTLLTNPEKKYNNLIEWTANMHDKEFRMLEPETIAIWWGHHKNKPSMTYDKFSRSLRYYYDKGILKKIPGERYVYRFLIDPELMYHHIGTSDSRPKIKPMPQAAKVAMSKFHKSQDHQSEGMPIITQEPEPLEKHIKSEVSSIQTAVQSISRASLEPWGASAPLCSSNSLQVSSTNHHLSASTGNLEKHSSSLTTNETDLLPMKRCRSLECTSNYSQFDPMNPLEFVPGPSSCPNDLFSFDLTVHSQVHTIVSQVNELVSSPSYQHLTAGCDLFYSMPKSS